MYVWNGGAGVCGLVRCSIDGKNYISCDIGIVRWHAFPHATGLIPGAFLCIRMHRHTRLRHATNMRSRPNMIARILRSRHSLLNVGPRNPRLLPNTPVRRCRSLRRSPIPSQCRGRAGGAVRRRPRTAPPTPSSCCPCTSVTTWTHRTPGRRPRPPRPRTPLPVCSSWQPGSSGGPPLSRCAPSPPARVHPGGAARPATCVCLLDCTAVVRAEVVTELHSALSVFAASNAPEPGGLRRRAALLTEWDTPHRVQCMERRGGGGGATPVSRGCEHSCSAVQVRREPAAGVGAAAGEAGGHPVVPGPTGAAGGPPRDSRGRAGCARRAGGGCRPPLPAARWSRCGALCCPLTLREVFVSVCATYGARPVSCGRRELSSANRSTR